MNNTVVLRTPPHPTPEEFRQFHCNEVHQYPSFIIYTGPKVFDELKRTMPLPPSIYEKLSKPEDRTAQVVKITMLKELKGDPVYE